MDRYAWRNTLRALVMSSAYQAMQVPFVTYATCTNILKLPHPVNMTSTRLAALDGSWFVTYKADGTRCLWIRASFMGVSVDVVLNRCCEMRIIHCDAQESNMSGICYMLDCEQVDDVFVCHDVLIYERVSVMYRAFSKCIKMLYMLREHGDMPQPKSFFPCSQIQMVPKIGDGYIFVHASNMFQTGKTESIIKWKDLRDISIDLFIDVSGNVMMSSQQGHTKFQGKIGQSDLISECKGHIMEFKYDDSTWIPTRIRHDKNTANDAYVVQETVMSAEQPILLGDLIAKCHMIQ